MVIGVIELFDVARGDGIFRSETGESLYFHCVTIADGTRNIEESTRARARRSVGLLGRDEVADVQTLS